MYAGSKQIVGSILAGVAGSIVLTVIPSVFLYLYFGRRIKATENDHCELQGDYFRTLIHLKLFFLAQLFSYDTSAKDDGEHAIHGLPFLHVTRGDSTSQSGISLEKPVSVLYTRFQRGISLESLHFSLREDHPLLLVRMSKAVFYMIGFMLEKDISMNGLTFTRPYRR